MQIKEIIEKFEEKYPLSIQESWDNSGIQVGDVNQELTNIITTLEITPETIEFAIEQNANLIISHHPIIFPSINSISMNHFKGKKIIPAIKNDIVIYASHTPSDQAGLNKYVFEKLGFNHEDFIESTGENIGYGSIMTASGYIEDVIELIKEKLDLSHVIFYGLDKKYTKIALQTGSGMSFIENVKSKNVDLFITSDISHHQAMDAIEQGINLIDISHEGSERLFMEFAENYLKKYVEDDVRIILYKNEDKYLRKIR